MMDTSHLTYAALLFFSGCVSFFYIWIVWPRRAAPGVKSLQAYMVGATIWAWTYCLHWLYPEWPARFFWLDATYIGVVIVPTAMVIFALQVSSNDQWLTKKTLSLFFIEPVLTLILLFTDPYHGIFFGGKRSPLSTDIYEGGVWFYVSTIYIYVLSLITLIVILQSLVRVKGVYRQQYAMILAGVSFPFLANLVRFLGLAPFPGLDLTPIAFIFQGLIYTFSVFRFSTFDLIPVAHEALMETMPEGLLVVDNRWRLVEINQSALEMLHEERSGVIGSGISYVLRHWPELEKTIKRADRQPQYYQVQLSDRFFMGVNITPLFNKEGQITGRLVTGRDITKQLQTEAKLEEANLRLRNQLHEIKSLHKILEEQAIHDPLTGLLNRRFFEESLKIAVARADRKKYPITILILDIDEFKRINDTYGHAAGDTVLENLGALLARQTRSEDLAVRLGGEEFLVLMKEVHLEQGLKRAEEIRLLIEKMETDFENVILRITVSIGAAEYPSSSKSMRDVMRKADQALYRAKFKGRNQVAR